MLFIGSDPDLLKTSLCLMDIHGKIHALVLLKIGNQKGEKAQQKMVRMMMEVCSREFSFPDKQEYTVICEGQRFTSGYGTRKKQANPQDLIHLGQMSGYVCGCIASGISQSKGTVSKILIPYPQEWKGSISKDKHHRHICTRMHLNFGIVNGHVVPLKNETDPLDVSVVGKTSTGRAQKLNTADWSDIMDSIGLAEWGVRRHLYGEKIKYQYRRMA